MAKEFDDKACNLDMPPGLHGIDYPARYMHAPKSCYPEKNSKHGEKVEASKAMAMTMHAKG